MGATWNTSANGFDPISLVAIPRQTSSGTQIEVNLTPLVQAWVNAAIPNYGLMLIATSEGTESKYTSREWGGSAERPKLDIVTATMPVASRATIVATGTLANGLQRQLKRTKRPLYQSPSTVIYQPGAGLQDAFIGGGAQEGKNYGVSSILNLSNDRNIVARFALEALPPGVRIMNASLSLYLEGGSGVTHGVLDLHRLTRSWIEGIYDDQSPPAGGGVTYQSFDGQTNWNTSGGDYDPAVIDSVTLPTMEPGWYEWNVTEQVEAWLDGVPNNGFLLREGGGDAGDIDFTSSDSPATEHHPRLILTLACECGVACILPKGSGKVLLVVDDATNPTISEQTTRMLLESWGYTINLISDDDTQPNFNTAVANNDVVYVLATAGTSLGIKLKDAPLGVVYEDGTLNDEFGVASGGSWSIGTDLNISNNTHRITAPFMSGGLPIKTDRSEFLTVSGTAAAGLQPLADVGGADSLVVLDQGAQLEGGGTAAGRRVMLPLGRDADYNWRYLNNNGRVIVQRALDWANPAPACTQTFADNFDTDFFSNSDGDFAWLGDWIEVDAEGAGPTSGNATISGGRLVLDDRPDTGGQPSLAREVSLSAFSTATVTFDYELGSGTDQGSDVAILEVSADGGSNWIELQDFSAYSGGDAGSLSFDLTPYLDVKTRIRFRIDGGYTNSNEFLAIDNLKIKLPCGEGPPVVPACNADYIPTQVVSEFSTSMVGSSSIKGLTYLPEGKHFLGVTAPAGGGWISVDSGSDSVLLTDGSGNLLANTATPGATPTGVAWVSGGNYADHLAITDYFNKAIAWMDMTGTTVASIPLSFYPLDVAFIGTTVSGMYDQHLAILGINGEFVLLDQSGTIKASSNIAGDTHQAEGLIHIANTDYVLVADRGLDKTLKFDLSGSLVDAYAIAGFGSNSAYAISINLQTCDHVLADLGVDKVISLNAGGGGGGEGGSSAGQFRDEFTQVAFDNNDGTLNWSGSWVEIDGDGAGPGSGNVLISGGQLRLDDRPNTRGQPSLEREVDLSSYISASLSFSFETGSGVDKDQDGVVVEVSSDGGANWQVLEDFKPVGRKVAATRNYDISAYMSANTRIRFRITSAYGGKNEYFQVDNVNIEVAGP